MSDLYGLNTLFIFLLGACLGSFANVIIYRWPKGESIVGRSHCENCQKTVTWYHNIPLVSYFVLRGKCQHCQTKFSWRYPLVEFIMAALFAAVYAYYGNSFLTVEYLILVFGLVTASFIDLDHMLLPDVITISGIILGLLGAILNPERSFMDGFLGFLFGGGVLWLVAYVYYVFTGREGLGGGDIKLLAWLGSILGWKAIPFIILSASILGSVVGLVIAYKNKAKQARPQNSITDSVAVQTQNVMQTMIPFGPFIAIGALLYLLGLKSVGTWYVDLFFPSL